MLGARPIDRPRAETVQHRHQRLRHHAGPDQTDNAPAQLAGMLLQCGTGFPAPSGAAGPVEPGQIAQRGEHQQQRRLGHGRRVGAGHVGDGDAARPRRREVDRVDADADLLDQPEPGRLRDDRSGRRLQDMQQHLRLGQQRRERGFVRLGTGRDVEAVGAQRGKPGLQTRPGIVMEDRLHHPLPSRHRQPSRIIMESSSEPEPAEPTEAALDRQTIAAALDRMGLRGPGERRVPAAGRRRVVGDLAGRIAGTGGCA